MIWGKSDKKVISTKMLHRNGLPTRLNLLKTNMYLVKNLIFYLQSVYVGVNVLYMTNSFKKYIK